MCDIFLYRGKEYKEKGALTRASNCFERMVNLYHSGKADFTTIEERKTVPLWIKDRKTVLHPKKKKREHKYLYSFRNETPGVIISNFFE